MTTPPLAGGTAGPDGLRPLLEVVLDALHDGAAERGGPFPAGGPGGVGARVRAAVEPVLPEQGIGAGEALRSLVHAVAQGSADPADPLCVAHLHNPPLALAVAADLAGSALNPSMDSWDQAPAASELEALLTRTLAAEVYPRAPAPDALVTTGGTESNQLGLLLAREKHGAVQVVCAEDAHHSVRRGAWLLGLPEPVTVPQRPGALDAALTTLHRQRPVLVVATAGTTDTGRIDPLPEIADLCERHRAELHIDAAYGGPLLFSTGLRPLLNGLDRAHSVTLDLHKLGWQPVAAGLLAVSDRARLAPLGHTAEYLNADDDTRAGLPDLLGRSLRTTRRPDVLKIAVTLKALGRTGLGALVDRSCATARDFAELVAQTPGLQLYERPTLSTVLFRPAAATDEQTARIRRALLTEGRAVLGRARPQAPHGPQHGPQHGGPKSPLLWLKATFLNPHATPGDLKTLIGLVLAEGSAPS